MGALYVVGKALVRACHASLNPQLKVLSFMVHDILNDGLTLTSLGFLTLYVFFFGCFFAH